MALVAGSQDETGESSEARRKESHSTEKFVETRFYIQNEELTRFTRR